MAYGMVSAIPEVHLFALLSEGKHLCYVYSGCQTLLGQYERDENVVTLVEAMHDAFDFANQKDTFRAIGRESKQAQILTLMLQHVCNCCDFIRSYARDPQFCTYSSPTSVADVNMRIQGSEC